jgi:hypothetical protein
VSLSFLSGSVDGFEMCTAVNVNSDKLVESVEDFGVVLSLVASPATSFSLGNAETMIMLLDSDGILMAIC